MRGRIASINRSDGGVPKVSIAEARATVDGLEGDRQRNRKYHGGPMRALCLYSLELIDALRAEGHPIVPGSVGENVTIEGLDWSRVLPGVRMRLGDAHVEVTSFTTPCKTIRRSFRDGDSDRIAQHRHPGWSRAYVRVLGEGMLRVGDAVTIED